MRLQILALIVLSVACANPYPTLRTVSGSATFTGTISGQTFSPQDAIFYSATATTTADNPNIAMLMEVLLTSNPNACSDANNQVAHPDASSLRLVAIAGPNAATTGTFAVSATNSAACGMFEATDANCVVTNAVTPGVPGTITLTTNSTTQLEGSFSFAMQGSSGVTGTFQAGVCNALQPDVAQRMSNIGGGCEFSVTTGAYAGTCMH